MTTREHVDKARLDLRNLADDLRKDVDAAVSEISAGLKKARADLANDQDRRRDRDGHRKYGKQD